VNPLVQIAGWALAAIGGSLSGILTANRAYKRRHPVASEQAREDTPDR